MNKLISGKDCTLQDETDLIRHFYALIAEHRILPFMVHANLHEIPGYDGHIEFMLDDRVLNFYVQFKIRPGMANIAKIKRHEDDNVLLVTPDLNGKLLQACKDAGISAMDLNGRVWLRAPGIYVERGPLPGRNFRYEHEPRNIFVGKSLNIVRCLLTDIDRAWSQTEIVEHTGASAGLVSRVIQYLISQGYVRRDRPRELRMHDHLGLVDAWAETDHFGKRTRTYRYAGNISAPTELAQSLQTWADADHYPFPIAFTQWIAAHARHPYTEPPLVSAYVSQLPTPQDLEQLGLREVQEGGKLWLHVSDDDGETLSTQTAGGLCVVSDAQIYIDLQRTGLRGPDAADALRNWEGFCRP